MVNILIVASLATGLILGGLVVETVASAGPTIAIGSVVGVFSNGAVQLHVPVEVHDGGYLGIQGVYVAVNLSDSEGHNLIMGSTGRFDVAPQSTRRVNLTLSGTLMGTPQSELNGLLTQDQSLRLHAILEATEQPLAVADGTVNGTLPWGAMLGNLTFTKGTVTPFNSTCSRVTWGVTFTNRNQYFRLIANVSGDVKDPSGAVVGQVAPDSVVVSRGSGFSGQFSALVLNSALQSAGSAPLMVELNVRQTDLFHAQIPVVLNA